MFITLAILLILLSALGGYCIAYLFLKILFKPYNSITIAGFRLVGFVPHLQANWGDAIAAAIKQEYLSEEKLLQQLTNPAMINQLSPAIEAHVDLFLKEKLNETFPLLYKMMGEKTLQKFKAAFLEEVETILPNLLQQYGSHLIKSDQIEKAIATQIKQLAPPTLEAQLHQIAGNYISQFKIAAMLVGMLIGLLQTILVYLFTHNAL
jgi:uncharacterized membrane protein YheB (UPF0754 family)